MNAAEQKELANERTEYAEDRTIMANERTFAGWMRTGLAAVGIGLGFNALFRNTDPVWVAKLAASIFIFIGVVIFVSAYISAAKLLKRLECHSAQPQSSTYLLMYCSLFVTGSLTLGVILWFL